MKQAARKAAGLLLDVILNPEDGGDILLRNVGSL
jgi:hypothetical protein